MTAVRRGSRHRQSTVIGYIAFLSVVMAFGVEAVLPAFDLVDRSMGFTERDLSVSLMVTALLVGMGTGQLLWGPVADAVGRRSTLIAGLGIYAVGAAGTALAPNLELVLAARLLWGIGAAAPNGLRLAIVRDLYEGEEMARIVTIATAVFLIGPVLMPILGEGMLLVGDWTLIAYAAVALAGTAMIVTAWFGETQPPDSRRPLEFGKVGEAVGRILRTPVSIGAIACTTLYAAAFFVYLGSAQPIIDRIYDRDHQFVWFFAASGVSMAAALILNDRLIPRFGTPALATTAAALFVVVDAVMLLVVLEKNGRPSVWLWLGWVCAVNACGVVVTSLAAARAMQPMGDIAGVAASVLAFCQLALASLLAAAVDSRIDLTVTPMIAGSFVYGAIGLGFLRWSIGHPDPGTLGSVPIGRRAHPTIGRPPLHAPSDVTAE